MILLYDGLAIDRTLALVCQPFVWYIITTVWRGQRRSRKGMGRYNKVICCYVTL